MCIIFISTQTAVWEEIQKYNEMCEKDEKTKKKTKTETAWFLLASHECYILALWYTVKRNTACIITTISVFSFISTNDCMELCWIKDVFQLISLRPAQTDLVMEHIASTVSPHILMVIMWRIIFVNCNDISNASVQHHLEHCETLSLETWNIHLLNGWNKQHK